MYSRTTNDRSNSPLQAVSVEYGTPCAYTNQQNVLASGQKDRDFYKLEVEGLRDKCQKLPKSSENDSPSKATDTRYTSFAPDLSTKPSEYQIQSASGVYGKLRLMPYFDYYCPNAAQYKSTLYYDFLGRATLDYDKDGCNIDIGNAIDVLQDMKDADGNTEGINEATWILACCFGCVQAIWMVLNTCIFLKCNKGGCGVAMPIIYSGVFALCSIGMVVCASINFYRLKHKYESLDSWKDYSGCVDSFMKISSYESESFDTILTQNKWIISIVVYICFMQIVLFANSFLLFAKARSI